MAAFATAPLRESESRRGLGPRGDDRLAGVDEAFWSQPRSGLRAHTPVVCDMGARMKTTIDLADDLARRAKSLARRDRRTLRALVEEGLRLVLGREGRGSRPYKLKDASFRGSGLTPEAAAAGWARIVEWSYGDRT